MSQHFSARHLWRPNHLPIASSTLLSVSSPCLAPPPPPHPHTTPSGIELQQGDFSSFVTWLTPCILVLLFSEVFLAPLLSLWMFDGVDWHGTCLDMVRVLPSCAPRWALGVVVCVTCSHRMVPSSETVWTYVAIELSVVACHCCSCLLFLPVVSSCLVLRLLFFFPQIFCGGWDLGLNVESRFMSDLLLKMCGMIGVFLFVAVFLCNIYI